MTGLAKKEAASEANLARTIEAVGGAPMSPLVLMNDIQSHVKDVTRRKQSLSEGERRERESPPPEVDQWTVAGRTSKEQRREAMLPVSHATARGKSVQTEVMVTIPPGGSSSAAAHHGGYPSTERGENELARACFWGWHPKYIFAQMGQDRA